MSEIENKIEKDPQSPLVPFLWKSNMSWNEYHTFISSTQKGSKPLFDGGVDALLRTSLASHLYTMLGMFVVMMGFNLKPHLIICGFMLWPLIEVNAHKYLLHVLPDRFQPGRVIQCIHFLVHGYHHKFPRDTTYLLWPPAAALFVLTLFAYFLCLFTESHNAMSLVYGIYVGYSIYDVCHYFIHCNELLKTSPLLRTLLHNQIRGHNNHHFNTSNRGGPPYAVLHTWVETSKKSE